MNYYFEMYKDQKKEWRFRLRAHTKEVVATSESYKRKIDCKREITQIMGRAGNAEIKETTSGKL